MAELPHFDHEGNARMVDVGDKPETRRMARATAVVTMKPETLQSILNARIKKGDVFGLARVAGVIASKKTPDLIPLCHPVRVDSVDVDVEVMMPDQIKITSTIAATDRTGVEMEALTSAAAAALTVYDMCKSIDRGMTISEIRLEEKAGGKSGHFTRNETS